MKRGLAVVFVFAVILILSLSIVSAFSLGDFFKNIYGKITGKDNLGNQVFEWFNNLGYTIDSSDGIGSYRIIAQVMGDEQLVAGPSVFEFDIV